MYEMGVQRKAKPATQGAGTVGKEGLAAEKDNESGENMIASLLDNLLDDVCEQVELPQSLIVPDMTDDESDDEADDMWYDAEGENEEMAEGGLTKSEDED